MRFIPEKAMFVVTRFRGISSRQCSSLAYRSTSGVRDSSTETDLNLPDLTRLEQQYVKRQISVIMKPRFLEYPFGTETILELDPANPEVFDRLFPVKGLGVCQDACLAVIKKFCRGYQIPPDKKTRNLFRSRLTSPLVTERTLAGLEVFGMIPEDLLNNPHLPLMTFSEVAKCGKISEVTDGQVRISGAGDFLAGNGKVTPMRGKHIRNKIRDTQATLNTLGFGDFGDRLLDKVMEKFARNKKINYADIDKYLSKYFIQWLCREAKLDGKDTEKILGSATVTDFRDLARNVFILDKFVGVTDKKVLVRGAVTLDPLETLVTLNTYKQVASMALPSNSQPPVFELDHVLKPSGKFPATYRYLFLKSIGLDCQEAIHLMFKPKLTFATQARKSDVQSLIHQRSTLPNPNRRIEEEDNHRKISSEDFVKELGYTHPIYLTLMRERYSSRRVELEGLPPMEKWTRLKEEDPRDDSSKSESQPTRGHDKMSLHRGYSAGGMLQQNRSMSSSAKPPSLKPKKGLYRRFVRHLQDPIQLLTNGLRVSNIRRSLDPDFDPAEVERGAVLAASTVFKMIRTHDYEGLRGLLTPREYDDLMRRVETEWTDQLRNNVNFEPEDFDRIVNLGYRVTRFEGSATYLDVVFIIEIFHVDRVCDPKFSMRLEIGLCRAYGEGVMHDWTVSSFKIKDFLFTA